MGLGMSSAFAADDKAVDACVRAVKAQHHDGAAYKPGVDVHGKSVAPAGLQDEFKIKPPKVIEFPIQIDIAKRLGFDANGPYEAKQTVATVRIEGDTVTVNGQEIHTDETAALIMECRKGSK